MKPEKLYIEQIIVGCIFIGMKHVFMILEKTYLGSGTANVTVLLIEENCVEVKTYLFSKEDFFYYQQQLQP